jgi:uncharacterized protein (TIGR00106 family)
MNATADIQLVPIGEGVSVRRQVARAVALIEASGLEHRVHGYGTNVQGEVRQILELLEQIHLTLHEEGATRLLSYLKLGTRTDKTPTLSGKQL